MLLSEKLNIIVDKMIEGAKASTIHPAMVVELNALRTNGFNTRDLFGVRIQKFVKGKFDELPLEARANFFNERA